MTTPSRPQNDGALDALVTGAMTTDARSTPPTSLPGPRHRFAPGAVIAGRYRVVALLGRGGMGEVYRADDLTLDQPVALKFLPAADASDEARLGRFHGELRIARQVSHKNVCRVYDFGEADGHRFLTMEYVDGEDLASLLRRIGRIPHDKAVQIARQLCAGVAAAHERGVLHRDLKPANVMIDGEGNVRITDFGIATASSDTRQELVGTPQYMAPEQFAGQPASIGTDIYALGLTLFEVFTGRRAHESQTLEDLRRFHETGTVTTPSSLVRDLDTTVERIILRCLDRSADRRPQSALAVAAALPGGDALADALAAGETPSPALLAAAGESEALRVLSGVALLTVSVLGLLAFAYASPRASIVGRTAHDLPPEVLVDRAVRLMQTLGYTDAPGDTAYDFVLDEDYLNWIQRTRRTPQRWDVLSTGYPSALRFWYRTSPTEMQPLDGLMVTLGEPAMVYSNMRLIVLDAAGRLVEFRAVPPQVDTTTTPPALSWQPLFDAAGLDMTRFVPAASQWTPPDFADIRVAWEGPMPPQSDGPLRIEAAAFLGKPVSFVVVGPWTRPRAMFPPALGTADEWIVGIIVTVSLAFLLTALLLARRHLKSGRADLQGATRLAVHLGTVLLIAWAVRAHHVRSSNAEFESFFRAASLSVLVCILLWTIYIALEPYVRRFWPHSLLGWSRLLAGHVRDPRVGRDVLIGVLFGVMLAFGDVTRAILLPWLGFVAPRPTLAASVELFTGAGPLVAQWIAWAVAGVRGALLTVLIIVVLRLALRWNWLVLGVTALFLGVASLRYMGSTNTAWIFAFPVASGALLTLVAVRFGLLTLVVTWFVWDALYGVPMTLDVSHWSATPAIWTLALLVGLSFFGFYASRAGQPLFGSILKE